jgi:ferredoxin-NADP reductase
VTQVRQETSTAWTLVLDVPGWPGHLAGQYVDVRITTPEGAQPKRSFSIASPPQEPRLALTIERLKNAEVSSHLCDEVREGDQLEVRGPMGSFTWDVGDGGPLLLVAAGSGIVPLMAMLRYRALELADKRRREALPARLLYSSRRWDDVIYREELERLVEDDDAVRVTHTITRDSPSGWAGLRRRIDRGMLAEIGWMPLERPRIYVCGPTPFVEFVTAELAVLGHDAALIRTERFGPTK